MNCPACRLGPVFAYICNEKVTISCKEDKSLTSLEMVHYHCTCLNCHRAFIATKEEVEAKPVVYIQGQLFEEQPELSINLGTGDNPGAS